VHTAPVHCQSVTDNMSDVHHMLRCQHVTMLMLLSKVIPRTFNVVPRSTFGTGGSGRTLRRQRLS